MTCVALPATGTAHPCDVRGQRASILLVSRLVGHTTTATSETAYRHELRPVITEGA
jgi:hypothetical protein